MNQPGEPIAVVGLACRYPDADDPGQLWEAVLHRRRAFRRLPPQRLDLTDYWDADRDAPDRTYSTQAAVLEGWRFDREAFRIPGEVFRAADPAHWLALETAARALDDAGHPAGAGLDRDRVAVVIGNSLTGEVTRARTLRLRWPYVRRVLESTLSTIDKTALERIEHRYLSAFPEVGDETLAGGLANTIAGRICNQFDFRGGGYTVDGACASSLLAVVTVCRALADRAADFGIAGGVDLSLDPFELIGFAKAGALADEDMRIYDRHSAGFWPGEGCGMLALMRASDARAAGVPVYAELLGWGISSDGRGGITRPEVIGQALALRRAAAMAGIEHTALGLYEGHGTGTAVGDLVELTALGRARAGAARPAALGSVKANIGHTKAAAGVAGVLKAVLSIASGTLPPTTGCRVPHPALGETLRVLPSPEPWPAGPRLAGVSAMGFGGINTHLVLGESRTGRPAPPVVVGQPAPEVEVVAVSGPTTAQVRDVLDRIATLAPTLSQAELHDLACHYGRLPATGPVRAALAVSTPAELGARAAQAAGELIALAKGALSPAHGVWLGNDVAGRVTLLFPGQGVAAVDTAEAQPAIYRTGLAAMDLLDELGVTPAAAIGHSLGEITALVWSGRLSPKEGARLVAERGRIMAACGTGDTGMLGVATDPAGARALCAGTGLVVAADNGPRAQVLAGRRSELDAAATNAARHGIRTTVLPVSHAFHSPAMAGCVAPLRAVLDTVDFQRSSPRTVVSTVHGRPLGESDDPVELLARQLLVPVRFWPAVRHVLADTDLFLETGPGRVLSELSSRASGKPAVSMDTGDRAAAESAAALFAAAAAKDLTSRFAGRFARPFDLRRDREFLANPCSAGPVAAVPRPRTPVPEGARDTVSTVTRLLARATELDPALIRTDARLLSDLNLSSLRATQLVAEAAAVLGRRPPEVVSDASIADLAAVLEEQPVAETPAGGPVPGVRPWIRCFTEATAPARGIPWRPTESAYLPDPEDVDAVLAVARKALHTKALVVGTHDTAVSGFLRSVCREHPGVGITLVRLPHGSRDLDRFSAEPGRWAELVVTADGLVGEPVEQPLPEPGPADRLPVNGDDVVLVTGGGKGIGYACGRALAAATGAALAVLGRTHPEADEALRGNLDRLRAEGIRSAYSPADIADPEAVRLAVAALEAELGPVTAVLHASGVNEPARFDQLDAERFRRHLRPKVTGLRTLLAALDGRELRLVVTFGSVIGRHGLPGASHYALANGLLRAEAERLAHRRPGCRVLNLDWSAWAGTGMADRLGAVDVLSQRDVTPIPADEGTDLFLGLLSTRTPVTVSVRGRLGESHPTGGNGRFLQRIRAHHPGVEVVADSTLSTRDDPWLEEHRLDGLAVLPAVAGLEAMAQAASLLAGRALRVAENVTFDRPVVVPDAGERTIRVCALRSGPLIETVLRSAESEFRTDHFRAEFPLHPSEFNAEVNTVDRTSALDPGELYGPVFFHTGRFRRIAEASVPDPRSCRATLTPDDNDPFTPVLGSATVNDASVHALQVCVPHRRLLPVGCDRVEVGPDTGGPWELHGVERAASGGRYTWDVVVADNAARPRIRWSGLRLADTGPLLRDRPWPPPLLAALLERSATGIGLHASLRVSVSDPFAVTAQAGCPAACAWEPVAPQAEPQEPELARILAGPCAEEPDRLATRVRTVLRCRARLGGESAAVRFLGAFDGGWLLLGSGDALIASTVLRVTGVSGPVAIALATTGARP
ncbi:type I polyketide synthase [Amycolatopsis anabasis]|uniref:type I polyketide synthase n=1 Tax=Amycolatopsis anabasis TaxID=1840409 RepID=UPI00131C741F|nr:type I polyketide synthase [Amycolatopsis anabasis]